MTGLPDPRLSSIIGNAPFSPWPPVSDDKHAVLAAMCFQFDRSQWLSADTIAAQQREQLVRLADFHARATPAFADRLAAARLAPADLADPAAFTRLAELTRVAIQSGAHRTAEEAIPPMHRPTGKANTSGSTGEPVLVHRTSLNRLHWLALSVRFHMWAEPDFGGRLAVIRANLSQHGLRDDWATRSTCCGRPGRCC